MCRIFSVIRNRIINPFQTLVNDYRHSYVRLGTVRLIDSVFRGSAVGNKITKKKHEIIINILEEKLCQTIAKYNDYDELLSYENASPVWVCWFQGVEKAPELVKRCVKSIKHSTKHPVNIISNENIAEYCKLPEYIIEKYNKGIITNAQYSDILRMTLLSEYGGLWIDATVFIPKRIPEKVFDYDFYTCKRNLHSINYVSDYRWTSFINGCKKGCLIQRAMRDLFFEYWKTENYLIDYLLVDYFMEVIYRNNPIAKKLIDDLPYNNSQIDCLQSVLNQAFDEDVFNKLMNSKDTFLFKLSWRIPFNEKTESGEETYYGFFVNKM